MRSVMLREWPKSSLGFGIFAALAEFEAALIRERVML
jgi:DNA invertase Pin-like site-specific DNA recombinase